MNPNELVKTYYDNIQNAKKSYEEAKRLLEHLPHSFSIMSSASILAESIFTNPVSLEELLIELDKFNPPLEYSNCYAAYSNDLAVRFITKFPIGKNFWAIIFDCNEPVKALEYFTGGTCKLVTKKYEKTHVSVECALADYEKGE